MSTDAPTTTGFAVAFSLGLRYTDGRTSFDREERLPFAPFVGLDVLDDALGQFTLSQVAWLGERQMFLCHAVESRSDWSLQDAIQQMAKAGWVEDEQCRETDEGEPMATFDKEKKWWLIEAADAAEGDPQHKRYHQNSSAQATAGGVAYKARLAVYRTKQLAESDIQSRRITNSRAIEVEPEKIREAAHNIFELVTESGIQEVLVRDVWPEK